jgi:hypothetical protein
MAAPNKNKRSDEAIHYNENAAKYAASGKPQPAADRAKRALQDPKQASELKRAEKAGKRRSH